MNISRRLNRFYILSLGVSLVLAVLTGLSVHYAVHTDVNLEKLGVVVTIILVIIPAKAVLNYLLKRKIGGQSQEFEQLQGDGKPQGLSLLKTAPLELTARQDKYIKLISDIKTDTIKKEVVLAIIKNAKFFVLLAVVILSCLFAYLGVLTIGVAAGILMFFLINDIIL